MSQQLSKDLLHSSQFPANIHIHIDTKESHNTPTSVNTIQWSVVRLSANSMSFTLSIQVVSKLIARRDEWAFCVAAMSHPVCGVSLVLIALKPATGSDGSPGPPASCLWCEVVLFIKFGQCHFCRHKTAWRCSWCTCGMMNKS